MGSAAESVSGLLAFTDSEIRSILRHGPWPAPWTPDPSNRVSGKAEAIDLGERLFFDPRVSGNGKVSCSTCHKPERGWTDGRKRGVALAEVDRNTPHIMNLRLNRWYSWDGANDNLWAQSIRPILDAREFGASSTHVAQLMRTDADLACRYEKVFGQRPSVSNDEAVLVDAAKALAAFQETLASGRTPFDEFRDALDGGDIRAAARYPQAAQRGLKIFIGKGGCATCHVGPNFTNGEFGDIGIRFFKTAGGVDSGRHDGIKQLKASPFNLLGPYNDDAERSTATGTRHVALDQRNFGEFRVPSLRDAALSGPYMHNGEVATLRDVVLHYSELNEERLHADGERILKPLKLSAQEIDDLVVFIESLANRSRAPRRPKVPGDGPRCK